MDKNASLSCHVGPHFVSNPPCQETSHKQRILAPASQARHPSITRRCLRVYLRINWPDCFLSGSSICSLSPSLRGRLGPWLVRLLIHVIGFRVAVIPLPTLFSRPCRFLAHPKALSPRATGGPTCMRETDPNHQVSDEHG